ncbi:hypothetical protein ACVWZV_000304 [Bradyrhizobium sp. GM5.1]
MFAREALVPFLLVLAPLPSIAQEAFTCDSLNTQKMVRTVIANRVGPTPIQQIDRIAIGKSSDASILFTRIVTVESNPVHRRCNAEVAYSFEGQSRSFATDYSLTMSDGGHYLVRVHTLDAR